MSAIKEVLDLMNGTINGSIPDDQAEIELHGLYHKLAGKDFDPKDIALETKANRSKDDEDGAKFYLLVRAAIAKDKLSLNLSTDWKKLLNVQIEGFDYY